jgi:hypothetical protein
MVVYRCTYRARRKSSHNQTSPPGDWVNKESTIIVKEDALEAMGVILEKFIGYDICFSRIESVVGVDMISDELK